MSHREQLLKALDQPGSLPSSEIERLIGALERERPANLTRQLEELTGVWELRWSSSKLPYLTVAPWLENLQVLEPASGRAMNLLRISGAIGALAGISVEARIAISGPQRVTVNFQRGGWLGPRLGERRLRLMRNVNQSFPAWLDVTVLDQELRISRGNAGTLFALRRRPDLLVHRFLEPATAD